jgi:hypothetical protein
MRIRIFCCGQFGAFIKSINAGWISQPGPHIQNLPHFFVIQGHIFWYFRPWADDAHMPHEYIPELWQFV